MRVWLLLLPLEGPLCLQFTLLYHPKRGPLGQNQSNLTPSPSCHPQVCLEFQAPRVIPLALTIWKQSEIRGWKSRKGSAILCPVSYLVHGSLFRVIRSCWSARPSGQSGGGEQGGIPLGPAGVKGLHQVFMDKEHTHTTPPGL